MRVICVAPDYAELMAQVHNATFSITVQWEFAVVFIGEKNVKKRLRRILCPPAVSLLVPTI